MLDLSTIRTVLFDMDGVLYRGATRLPGVVELMSFCDQHHIHYACITNNAGKTSQQFEHKLAGMGVTLPGSRVFSSSLVAGHYLRSIYPRGTTAYVIGMDGLQDAIFGDGYFVLCEQRPQVVVLGIDFHVTYAKLKVACLAIRAGARFVAANTDRTFPSEEGLVPGAGALVAFVRAATDVEPLVIGKPQPLMFQTALAMLGAEAHTTLVVGDRLETDIAGAREAGIQSALVLTGVTQQGEIERSPHQPDGVFEDLLHLLEEWKQCLSE